MIVTNVISTKNTLTRITMIITITVKGAFVFLLGGQVLEDVVFINLDQSNCCAFFNDPTTEPGSTLIVDCQDIQAIRIEAD